MVPNWLAELDGRRVTVEVPASTANLGAGYDCLGLALDLSNRIEVEVRGWSRGEVELEVEGEGEDELTGDRQNRFVRGLEAALVAARGEIPDGVGWRVAMRNGIPLTRGLGSSSAATIGGLVAGNALAGDVLATRDLLRLATEIEGHPDNAAAALLGGFVVSVSTDEGVEAIRFDVPRDLRCVLFIPERRLSTEEMRRALPEAVPLVDAIANLGRVALGVAGLAAHRVDLLRVLTVDRLHEPYRAVVYPQLPRLVEGARAAGALGACLSGAGSTVIAFTDRLDTIARIEAAFSAVAADMDLPGRVAIATPENQGAKVTSRT
jgi:homoserine kinase